MYICTCVYVCIYIYIYIYVWLPATYHGPEFTGVCVKIRGYGNNHWP